MALVPHVEDHLGAVVAEEVRLAVVAAVHHEEAVALPGAEPGVAAE